MITMRAQAAATGSNDNGGDVIFTAGADDGSATFQGGFIFGKETVLGGTPPATNYFGLADLFAGVGGVVHLELGPGANGTGSGVAGVEISCFSELNIATENNSPINILPNNGAGAFAEFAFTCDVPTSLPALSFFDVDHATAATLGLIRMPYGTGQAGSITMLANVASDGTTNLPVLSRFLGELWFGSFAEENRYHTDTQTLFEVFRANGLGFQFQGPFGQMFAVRPTMQKTLSYGGGDNGRDGYVTTLYDVDSTVIAAGAVIATIALQPGLNQLTVSVEAWDTVANDFATFNMSLSYLLVGGVVTPPTAAATATDTGHTAAAAAVAASAAFAVSGTNIEVTVTTWTANPTHWVTKCVQNMNANLF